MKAGDIVQFRYCAQQGKMGMITMVPKQSHLAKSNPDLRLYMILSSEGVQCFTGNQTVSIRYYCRFCGYASCSQLNRCPQCGSSVPLKEW